MIKNRNFTLYQKAALVNSLISSKIWYAAHTYPLPVSFVKLINKVIFQFIWNSQADHIKRDILCSPRLNGGIGLINIELKAKSIFTATTIKILIKSEDESLIRYYIMAKINKITKLGNSPKETSICCTPYYEKAIENVKKIHTMKNFPNVNSKEIYLSTLPKIKPRVEIQYPNYNWNKIWKNLNYKYINVMDRCIVYKFLHEILPTNKRLKQMRIKNDSKCNYCSDEDSLMHKFYHCHKIRNSVNWLTKFIEDVCNIKINNMSEYLMLDFPYINRKMVNTLSVIICNYIACIWLNRDDLEYIDKKLKAKIIRERSFLSYIHRDKFKQVFCSRYCDLKFNQMNYR